MQVVSLPSCMGLKFSPKSPIWKNTPAPPLICKGSIEGSYYFKQGFFFNYRLRIELEQMKESLILEDIHSCVFLYGSCTLVLIQIMYSVVCSKIFNKTNFFGSHGNEKSEPVSRSFSPSSQPTNKLSTNNLIFFHLMSPTNNSLIHTHNNKS